MNKETILQLIEQVRAENTAQPHEYRYICHVGAIVMVDSYGATEMYDCPVNRDLIGKDKCASCCGKVKGELYPSDAERMRNAGVQLMADGMVSAIEETD